MRKNLCASVGIFLPVHMTICMNKITLSTIPMNNILIACFFENGDQNVHWTREREEKLGKSESYFIVFLSVFYFGIITSCGITTKRKDNKVAGQC